MNHQRQRPRSPQPEPLSNTIPTGKFSRLLGLERHEPLDAEARAEIDLLIKAGGNGPALTQQHHCQHSSCVVVRCRRCRRPLSAECSVQRGYGWRCAKHLQRVGGWAA